MWSVVAYIGAILCFLLVVFNAPIALNLTALGLAFIAVGLLVGHLPVRRT
jgi:hypothetical protein